MNQAREDLIYELQQALAELPPATWWSYLTAHCPEDETIRAEVLARQARLTESGEADPPNVAFGVDREPVAASPLPSSLPADAAWLNSLGYDLLNEVGRGGMGIVYRVRDRKRRQIVALKTLQEHGPASLVRFKQEFRALAEVTHPNLAALHDVVSDGRRWCFTMEFVNAVDFLTFVRDGIGDGRPLPPARMPRLRAAVRQLVEGLMALHAAGIVHRDVKPSNVLVAKDQRLVLVDFGLAAELGPSGLHQTRQSHVTGTLAYMSPEQAAGQPLSPASDWYSVGVMLFEALTGRLPFDGSLHQVLHRKIRENGPPPARDFPEVPDDLNQLCTGLLRRDPDERATGSDVLQCVTQMKTAALQPERPSAMPLVGRENLLRELEAAFDAVRCGRPTVVLIPGPSGVGKTTLMEQFLARLDPILEPVVLSGRCYEQEAVPYKALDSAMDALARYLGRLQTPEVQALLPRDAGPLCRVFPIFRSVRAIATAPTLANVREPQELRRRAVAGLRELFARLGDRRPLVLAIDDLQWGDVDSAVLLRELLHGSDPPLILFVGTFRTDDEQRSPFLRALFIDDEGALVGLHARRVEVTPLTELQVRELVLRLTHEDALAHAISDDVARECGGNPFFVTELLRFFELPSDGRPLDRSPDAIDLDEVIGYRVESLSDRQRRLLETIAICSGPLDETIVCEAAGAGPEGRADLRALRTARLVKTTTFTHGIGVETYHDRIRQAVSRRLSADRRSALHRKVFRALEIAGGADDEMLALHSEGAGEFATAATHYAAAGDRAAAILAFDRAARFYELALTLAPVAVAVESSLRRRLGDAHANAGRGVDAAREYLRAAETSPTDALELRRRAAMQLLISGHVDEGTAAVRSVLDAVGMRLPTTPRDAVISLLFRRIQLRVRGLRFQARPADQIPADEVRRVDVSWSVAIGLSLVDPIRAAAFQSLNVLLALDLGEPYRVSRALALEAAHISTGGTTSARRTAELLAFADRVATADGHPHGRAMIHLARGIAEYLQGRWVNVIPDLREAQRIFQNECVGAIWESSTALVFELYAMAYRGEISDLRARLRGVLRGAEERDNLYISASLGTFVTPLIQIADGQVDEARRELSEAMQRWSRRGFHVQHANGFSRQIELDLYLGIDDGIVNRAHDLRKLMSAAHLTRVQIMRIITRHLYLRAILMSAESSHRPSPSLKSALRGAAQLQNEGSTFGRSLGQLVEAAVAARHQQVERAVELLRDGSLGFEQIGLGLYATACRRRLGRLVGGDEGRELMDRATNQFTAQGIKNADRLTAMLAPGFGE